MKISLVPNLDPERTTICPNGDTDRLPPVELVALQIQLESRINIRCHRAYSGLDEDKTHFLDFNIPSNIIPATIPLFVPGPDQKINHQNPKASGIVSMAPHLLDYETSPSGDPINSDFKNLDLGAKYSIYLGTTYASVLNQRPKPFKRRIYPTFATYNIALRYSLRLRLKIACAGDVYEISLVEPVKVLAPSEEQEAIKASELGAEGMKRNHEELMEGVGTAIEVVGDVLQAVLGN